MFSHTIALTAIFLIGVFAKRIGILSADDSKTISKIIIYFTMPALGFFSLANNSNKLSDFLILPALGMAIPLFLLAVAIFVSKYLDLPRRTEAIFLSSSTVANLGYFLYPFFSQLYKTEGLTSLVIYDVGNTIIAYSLTYYVILRYSDGIRFQLGDFIKILRFPPLWAIVAGTLYGITIQITGWKTPPALNTFLELVSQANTLLAMLLLGMSFHIKTQFPVAAVLALMIRMLGGITLGFVAASILNLSGLTRLVVILAPGMPVGLSNLIYAVQQDLDVEFAASLITISVILGFIILNLFVALG